MVSVIIPTKNRPNLLERALDSVSLQTYDNLECIVVDDGSDTPASEVVDRIGDPRIRCIRHETSKGASAARNSGIRASEGRYLAFLDDDDEWLPTKLEKQVKAIEESPDSVGLVHCWMVRINDENGQVESFVKPALDGSIFKYVLSRQPLGNVSCWLVHRSMALELGGFDETLPRGNDGDFLRRLCLKRKVDCVPQVLVRYHLDHGHRQITRSDFEGIRNAIRSQQVKLEKFDIQLKTLPRQRASIHSRIAYRYGQLRDWNNCLHHFKKAFRSDPRSLRTVRDAAALIIDMISNKRT